MGKQTLGRIKNTLAILLVVLFVLSVTAAAISAKTEMGNSGLKSANKTTVEGKNVTATKTTVEGKNITATETTVEGKNATVAKTAVEGKNATATKVTVTKKV